MSTRPQNPPNFDADTFSPPTRYRQSGMQEIVDNAAGFEPPATASYQFRGRTFVELEPYDDEAAE